MRRFSIYFSAMVLIGMFATGVIDVPLASATGPTTISGTVTFGAGVPAPNVCITAFDFLGNDVADATTLSDGTYTLQQVPNDDYLVEFDPTCAQTVSSTLATQFWNNKPDFGSAKSTPVIVTGTPVIGINAHLLPGNTITGTVTAPGAVNPANICVEAFSSTTAFEEGIAFTDATGAYDMTNIPADTYKVEFDPTCFFNQDTDFGVQYYNGSSSFNTATTFSLSGGATQGNVNGTVSLDTSPLSIATPSLPGGTQSSSYSTTVAATGGTGPYDFVGSGLPSGLAINASSGVISGIPTSAGSSTVSVTVIDASTPLVTANKLLTLSIAPPPVVTTTTLAPTTTTTLPTHTVCSFKTKKIAVDTIKIVKGKKVTVVTHKTVRVYKTVTVKKVEKIHGKKVTVVTHKQEAVRVCRTVVG